MRRGGQAFLGHLTQTRMQLPFFFKVELRRGRTVDADDVREVF